MDVLVVYLSGSSQKVDHYQEMILKSYWLHREWKQGKSLVENTLSFITNQSFFCTLTSQKMKKTEKSKNLKS